MYPDSCHIYVVWYSPYKLVEVARIRKGETSTGEIELPEAVTIFLKKFDNGGWPHLRCGIAYTVKTFFQRLKKFTAAISPG
jgi:hypothetical protein